MSDDRLQMPEDIEKAFEYAKGMPSDVELMKTRALTWEQVVRTGRRSQFRMRLMKPFASAVAGLAVVLAAVFVPQHLPGGVWTNHDASTGKSAPRTVKPVPMSDYETKSKMYQLEGKNLLLTDPADGYDLLEVPSGDQKDLVVAKSGVEHTVYTIPSTKKFYLAVTNYGPLVAFNVIDQAMNQGAPYGDLYVLNTDVLQVHRLQIGGVNFEQMTVWKQGPNKLSLVISTEKYNSSHNMIYRWDWSNNGNESVQPIYDSTNGFVQNIVPLGSHLVLEYPNQLVSVSDTGSQTIDKSTDQNFEMYGTFGQKHLFFYSVGQVPYPKFGSYNGSVRLKVYNFATGESQDLLPETTGDQVILTNESIGNLLVQNFVADDPNSAISKNAADVPGTYQLWMISIGQPPTLAYKVHQTGESFYYPEADTPHDSKSIPLVQDPQSHQPVASLYVDWTNRTVTLVKVHP